MENNNTIDFLQLYKKNFYEILDTNSKEFNLSKEQLDSIKKILYSQNEADTIQKTKKQKIKKIWANKKSQEIAQTYGLTDKDIRGLTNIGDSPIKLQDVYTANKLKHVYKSPISGIKDALGI